jgi:hypothetical protein
MIQDTKMASPEDPFDIFDGYSTGPILVEPPPRRIRYRDEADDDELPIGLSATRRWILIIVTIIVIVALVATTLLPALLAARYNEAIQMLPPPTVLPRI